MVFILTLSKELSATLTLYASTLQTGQTHSKNSSAVARIQKIKRKCNLNYVAMPMMTSWTLKSADFTHKNLDIFSLRYEMLTFF